jgi:hypothetical protein
MNVTGIIRAEDWTHAGRAALLMVVLVTAWRIFTLFAQAPNLSFDEAQYWAWAQSFEFGYYSKPPLVAWAIAASTSLCGPGEACIKLPSTLAHAVTALALYGAGAALFDRRTGFWASATYLLLPAVSFSSMLITTDPFLLAAWAVALWCFIHALRSDGMGWWLGLGAAMGVGMLAKYAMGFFVLSLFLYLGVTKERRVLLRSPGLWAALGLGLAIYAPNAVWNFTHGLVSYKHTGDNANLGGSLFHPGKMAEFFGAQFGVFGPLLFAAFLLILFQRPAWRDDRMRMLLWLAFPTLALMVALSIASRANANWSAPVYVAASLAVAAWALRRGWTWLLKASLVLHLAGAALLYNYEAAASLLGPERAARFDPMKRVRGWDEVGVQVSRLLRENPGHRLLSDERKVIATLIYYVEPHPFDAVKWNPSGLVRDHYDQTTRLEPGPTPLIFVTENPDDHQLDRYFDKVEPLPPIEVRTGGRPITLRVFRLGGFRGF